MSTSAQSSAAAAPPSEVDTNKATEGLLEGAQRYVREHPGTVAAVAAVALAVGSYLVLRNRSSQATPVEPVHEKKAGKKSRSSSSKGTSGTASPADRLAAAAAADTYGDSPAKTDAGAEEKAEGKPVESMTMEARSEAAKAAKTKGNKYYQGNNFEKAIELYSEAIRLSPPTETANLAVYYSNRAACFSNFPGKEREIIADCTKALEYDARYVKALNRRAQAYESLHQMQSALYDYTAVCILESFQNERAVRSADRVLKEIGLAEATERIKTRVARLPSPHFITAYLDTFRNKEYDSPPALTNPATTAADQVYLEALQQVKERKYDEAQELFEKALQQQTSFMAEALNWRGTFLYLKGDLEAALSDFNASLTLKPSSVNALMKRGSIHLEKNDADGAIADFKTALDLEPNNSEIFYHRAQVFFLMNKLDDAIKDYEKSISIYQGIAYAHIQLAVSLYRLEKHDQALETFSRAEALFPESHDVFNYYGEVLMDQGRFDDALLKFETALKLAPNSPLAYINKGLLLFQMRRDQEDAMRLIKKAIEIDDRCDVAYAHLAQLYLQQNKIQEAIANYEKAAELTRTVTEMANVISCREAASAQLRVVQSLGIMPPPAQ